MNKIIIILSLIVTSNLVAIDINNKNISKKNETLEVSYEVVNTDSVEYVFILSHWFMNGLNDIASDYILYPTDEFIINNFSYVPSYFREEKKGVRSHSELRYSNLKQSPTFIRIAPEEKFSIRLIIDNNLFRNLKNIKYDFYLKMHYAEVVDFNSFFSNTGNTYSLIKSSLSNEFVIKLYNDYEIHYYPIFISSNDEVSEINLQDIFNKNITILFPSNDAVSGF